MPKTLQQLLYKEDAAINSIVPLVPSLWTKDPLLEVLGPMEKAYPTVVAIEHRLQAVIECLQASDLDKSVISTRVNSVKKLLTEGGPACALTRDYNGEYAPAIAALLSNGSCTVVPGLKPTSMIASMNAAAKKGVAKVYKREDFAALDNTAVTQITDEIEKQKFGPAYYKVEEQKCQALTAALFSPFEAYRFVVKTDGIPRGGVAMSDLHHRWAKNGTLEAFRAKVEEITPKKNRAQWFRGISREHPIIVKAAKPAEHEVAMNVDNVVKPLNISYAFWIRRQDPKDHSHNMGQDLLNEIVTAIARVSAAVYPGANFAFFLFGDGAARTMADLPVHSGGEPVEARKTPPQFMADKFHEIHPGANLSVVDLRDIYSHAEFKTPSLDALQGEAFGPMKTAENVKTVDKRLAVLQKANAEGNLSYSQQYSAFFAIDALHHPRFIIGAESGNMDGFGYCGIPVVSIDVEDENDMPTTITADRIGQYCLVTPLWEVLNYHRGAGLPLFRRHLYGAILKYTRYAGELHETKTGKPSSAIPSSIDKEDENKKTALDQASFLDFDAPEAWDTKVEGFVSTDVEGDGNCLFRALSVLLFGGSQAHHLLLRQEAVESAAALFELAVVNEDGDFEDMKGYKATMSPAATPAENRRRWGGFPEIAALAVRYDISIAVHSTGIATVTANPGKARTLDLLYVNRNHYKALTPE
jgi:hypothetical protein